MEVENDWCIEMTESHFEHLRSLIETNQQALTRITSKIDEFVTRENDRNIANAKLAAEVAQLKVWQANQDARKDKASSRIWELIATIAGLYGTWYLGKYG